MIVIYPMLTSQSVSPNVLPGIIKAVEKYILLYNTDDVLKSGSSTSAGTIVKTGIATLGAAVAAGVATGVASQTAKAAAPHIAKAGSYVGKKLLRQGEEYENTDDSLSEAPKPGYGYYGAAASAKTTKGTQGGPNVTARPERGNMPKLEIPRSDAISLEPTYLSVQTAKKDLQILGVKVVPFTIRSQEPMMSLLTKDVQLKGLNVKTAKYGRMFKRVFYRIMAKIPMTSIRDKVLTGDPMNDVVLGKTQYGKNMFLCFNKLDLQNDEMFSDPASLRKLQTLGWASIILLDDVNKRATFCMKEFGGICSTVPYSYIFSSLGKDHNKVYEDLEDVRRASGPFFRMNTNRRRAFAEGAKTSDKYLELIQK
jgi:hypothetical protein